MPKLTELPEWQTLQEHHAEMAPVQLRTLFSEDEHRGESMTIDDCGLLLDYSKNRIRPSTIKHLASLAKAAGLPQAIERMFTGEKINFTERRAVLHTALRNCTGDAVLADGEDVMPGVQEELERLMRFAERIRNGQWRGHTGERIRNVVNIGIGGSDLGGHMAYQALIPFSDRRLTVKFV